MHATRQSGRWGIAWWAVLGFIVGAGASSASIWPDLIQRVRWALGGGTGETAVWGEPLFYIVIVGAPWGLICGLIALGLSVVIRKMTGK